MMPFRARRLAALALTLGLSGCFGGLLGGGKPVQQYSLGEVPPAPQAAPAEGAPTTLTLAPVRFAAEIDGNRILTATGLQTAYLKDARWIAPAPSLFEAKLRAAFRNYPAAVLLTPAAEGIGPGRALSVDVSRFEAVYTAPGAVPSIDMAVSAVVQDRRHGIVASRSFRRTVPASGNSIAAVVAAFGTGSTAIVQEVAAWAAGAAARPDGPAGGR